ncbi:cob(I)yrinic acid a,c-diamide adenosyltransferase [Candidatus Parcubacteria bacterium]|nr:MAG: cob(I)yrinic acid a,c-diamide adenosyltransferase [Candidatus Parcubacteria bacterium]
MPIYTKKGDQGQTSLLNKQKVWKNSQRTTAYGTIDELNSLLGVVVAEIENSEFMIHDSEFKNRIISIQNDLFHIGSSLANPDSDKVDINLLEKVKDFEKNIDEMTAQMPPLSAFILPGGGRVGSLFQFARATARRAEREAVALFQKEKIQENILVYLNRLSDLLFTLSRFANYKENKKEVIWKKS